MRVVKVAERAKQFFSDHLVPVHKIISITPVDTGWEIMLEVIEEKEYMVASAKDEMIGVYKVMMDEKLEILSFSRIELRHRGVLD